MEFSRCCPCASTEGSTARKETEQPSGEASSGDTYDQDDSDHDCSNYEVLHPKTLPIYPEYIRLTNFTYNIHSPNNVQTFLKICELGIDFGIVVLKNWERDDFTFIDSACMGDGWAGLQLHILRMCMSSHKAVRRFTTFSMVVESTNAAFLYFPLIHVFHYRVSFFLLVSKHCIITITVYILIAVFARP